MSDSPRSESFPSRFSTPVNELDDHRLQPESLPRAEGSFSHGRTRRSTRRSTLDENPPLHVVRDFQNQTTSRDFEYAIADDEEPTRPPTAAPSIHIQFEESANQAVPRRDAFRRPRIVEILAEDRSVRSDRSLSPPDSVDAFNSGRRPRSGTATSLSPSFVPLPKSPSIGPKERRPTFSIDDAAMATDSSDDSVQDDVCFPLPEEVQSNTYAIDFDELHDFCATYEHTPTHVPEPFPNKQLANKQLDKAKVFHDLCKKKPEPESRLGSIQSMFFRRSCDAATADDSASSILDEKKAFEDNLNGTAAVSVIEPINRWSFFSSRLEETIHAPELGDLLMPGETFEHLFQLGPDGGVWWLDMLMPSEEEVEAICKAFGIHGLTREDIIQQETREKVELFKSYYFVCFRSFYQMERSSDYWLEPVNVYAVVFREGILTFTFCPSPHAANVRKRMGKLREYVTLGSDWICYALIDDIVDSYGPVIRESEIESETIEDNVFTARTEDSRSVLRQIGECRKTVMSLIRLLGGKADVIKGFAKRCNEQYSVAPRQDVGLYLSDIQDHVVTMMSSLSHFEKMLSRSHSNYLAQISVDNIAQGTRANEVLSKVTFIATILVPLNLVCGLFGMNVPVPGADSGGLGWFFGILGFLVFFVATCAAVAKRMRFI